VRRRRRFCDLGRRALALRERARARMTSARAANVDDACSPGEPRRRARARAR
jgi:hypothetical protein